MTVTMKHGDKGVTAHKVTHLLQPHDFYWTEVLDEKSASCAYLSIL